MTAPKPRMYPVDTSVAEKLEAFVNLGKINSRMKNFYDLRVVSLRRRQARPCDRRGIGSPLNAADPNRPAEPFR